MNTRALACLSFAVAALAVIPGSASAAIQVANAKSLAATQGQQIDHQRIVTFDDAGACAASAYKVTIAWGDGTTSDGSVVKALKSSPALCTYDAEGSHRYDLAGAFDVTATICRAAECVTTPVAGLASVKADEQVHIDAKPQDAPAAVAPQPQPQAAPQSQPTQQLDVNATTPALTVVGPVRRSQLAAKGLRVRLGAIGAAREFSARLVDTASGRTLGHTSLTVGVAQAASGATLRLRFSHKTIGRLHSQHRYALELSGSGLPSLATTFRVR